MCVCVCTRTAYITSTCSLLKDVIRHLSCFMRCPFTLLIMHINIARCWDVKAIMDTAKWHLFRTWRPRFQLFPNDTIKLMRDARVRSAVDIAQSEMCLACQCVTAARNIRAPTTGYYVRCLPCEWYRNPARSVCRVVGECIWTVTWRHIESIAVKIAEHGKLMRAYSVCTAYCVLYCWLRLGNPKFCCISATKNFSCHLMDTP